MNQALLPLYLAKVHDTALQFNLKGAATMKVLREHIAYMVLNNRPALHVGFPNSCFRHDSNTNLKYINGRARSEQSYHVALPEIDRYSSDSDASLEGVLWVFL